VHRRQFLASGLGMVAAAAAGRLTGTVRDAAVRAAQGTHAMAPSSGAPQGKWVSLAPFPEALEEVGGASVGGNLYVFGGLRPVWIPAGVVYQYDPATNTWTKKQPMAHPLHHPAIAVMNDRVYAFGGFVLSIPGPASWVPIDEAWEYDPATDSWRALAPMPTKRGAAVAAAVGGKLYIIGGATLLPGDTNPGIHPARPHHSLNTVEEYDPLANTWRPRTPMPTARNHIGVGTVNGKIYVIGGRAPGAFVIAMPKNLDVVEEYSPVTNSWATKAPLPTARSGGGVAVLSGRIYVAGGEVHTPQYVAAFRAFEAYDPASNTWTQLPYMPSPRHSFATGAVGNRMHVVSGDVQAAIVPPVRGVSFQTDAHDAYEVAP
jgi:N-acetylneuraminic acid mutarotase